MILNPTLSKTNPIIILIPPLVTANTDKVINNKFSLIPTSNPNLLLRLTRQYG
jgi:hypothetical protein